MILHPTRFGAAPLAAATFVVGLALGSLAGPERAGQPVGSAVASGIPVGSGVALDTPRYPVDVTRIIDGDTFEARVRAWPGIEIATKVRLRDIDAPEMRGRCEQEFARAKAARDALAHMLAEGAVAIARVSLDKYGGRVLAEASTARVGDVAAALLDAGLVRRYAGGRREPWC